MTNYGCKITTKLDKYYQEGVQYPFSKIPDEITEEKFNERFEHVQGPVLTKKEVVKPVRAPEPTTPSADTDEF